MRCAVFDCDGTLVDGQAAICETMELAFRNTGLAAPERNKVRRIVGLSATEKKSAPALEIALPSPI